MMARRPFLKLTPYGLAILGVIIANPARAAEMPKAHQTPANDFANKYNTWVLLLDASKPGVVDVREVRAWRDVVKAWHHLEKGVRYE